jgi:hypothetical protein
MSEKEKKLIDEKQHKFHQQISDFLISNKIRGIDACRFFCNAIVGIIEGIEKNQDSRKTLLLFLMMYMEDSLDQDINFEINTRELDELYEKIFREGRNE